MSDTRSIGEQVQAATLKQPEMQTPASRAIESEFTFAPPSGITYRTVGATALAQVIEIDKLYPPEPGSTSHLLRALDLLKQTIDLLSEARQSQNPMDSDRFVQRAQLELPKLFECRSVGDGFGVIVNSLQFAFMNLKGIPLTTEQLGVVWRILRELRNRPAMTLEQGVQHVQEFEDIGLEVDPPELAQILEAPDQEA